MVTQVAYPTMNSVTVKGMMGRKNDFFVFVFPDDIINLQHDVCIGGNVAPFIFTGLFPGVQDPLGIQDDQGDFIIQADFYRTGAPIVGKKNIGAVHQRFCKPLLIVEIFPACPFPLFPIVIARNHKNLPGIGFHCF